MTEGLYKGDCLDMMRAMEPEFRMASLCAAMCSDRVNLGRRWAGAEITEEYWPIIEARVAHAERTRQPELFDGEVC